jgi:hypothetical protein
LLCDGEFCTEFIMDVFVGPFCDAIASERIQRAADKLLQARDWTKPLRGGLDGLC